MRLRAWYVLLAVTLLLGGCVAPRGVVRDAPESPDAIAVLTFNVRMIYPGGRSLERWMARRNDVVDLIRRERAPLVALQEVANRDPELPLASIQLAYLRERLPEYTFACAAFPGRLSSQPILFDAELLELVNEGFLAFSEPEPTEGALRHGGEGRFASWALFRERATGRLLRVVNVHFHHLNARERRASSRITQEFLDGAGGPGEGIIVLGDFNTFPRSPAMRVLTDDDAAQPLEHALPPSRTGSYHFFSGITLWPRIDHVLINEELQSYGGALLYDRFTAGYPSDHFPAIAWLGWR